MNASRSADTLDPGAIARLLPPGVTLPIDVLAEVDSTNATLLRRADATAPLALLAERQTAGRGRRGRHWLAADAGSLCLSLQWRSYRATGEATALPLVAGLACAEALRGLGAAVGVKWPNDLCAGDAKLGGILVEARSGSGEGTFAVIGIGLNLRLSPTLRAALPEDAQPVTDLAALLPPPLPARNAIAAALLAALLARLDTFEHQGWPALASAWAAVDVLTGRHVRVRDARGDAWGEVLGLAGDGALRVRFADREACVHSGEVSIRP